LAVRTSSNSAVGSSGSPWGALLAGVASVVTLPLAVYLTRFSDSYELLHAGFAIPLGLALGWVALALSRRSRRRSRLSLARNGGDKVAATAHVLGALGVCLALAGILALGIYGLLEYVGTRD
jgi:hypothetical protein